MSDQFFLRGGDRLVADDEDDLRRGLEGIDVPLPDRRNGRRTAHVERYVLSMYLRLLVQENRLEYPLRITKRDSPDLHWQEGERSWGVEITEGASQRYQQAFTELEKAEPGSQLVPGEVTIRTKGDPRPVRFLVSDEPERHWAAELADRVAQKTAKLQSYDAGFRDRCDLLIWDNTEWAGFTGWHADELPGRLAAAIAARYDDVDPDRARFRRISVVREQLILHDVTGKGLLALHDVTNEAVIFASSRAASQLRIPHDRIAHFCQRHGIRKLGFFGSIHQPERFGAESDVDVLVEFQPDVKIGLIKLAGIEIELTKFVGRKVDLRSVPDLSRYFRDDVTRMKTELEYVAAST